MPYKKSEPDDPMELVGVVLPADAEAMRDMAYAFAEEFVRMGYDKRQLLSVFQNPYYAGAHGACRTLGETEILTIIDECINVWGRTTVVVQDVQEVQAVQPPPSSSPATRGRKEVGA
ncbi:MAG: hypothetical protein A3C54_07210 [Deltaproteobacteria bacterium RIFCSPHIGHO2_02_FULL_60_17]|nr:MAG: hypothetical protein A3C54_07210 [Deltaproteobacteria bacterium RIFCSPHIGHO2_02_FULL_60_17]